MHVKNLGLCQVTHLCAFAIMFCNVSEKSKHMPWDTVYFLQKGEEICVCTTSMETQKKKSFFCWLWLLCLDSHGDKKVFSCQGLQLAVNWFWDKGLRDITVFIPLWRKEQPRPEALITGKIAWLSRGGAVLSLWKAVSSFKGNRHRLWQSPCYFSCHGKFNQGLCTHFFLYCPKPDLTQLWCHIITWLQVVYRQLI